MSGLHLSSDVAHTREGRHLNHGSKELFPGDRGSKTLQVVLVLVLTDLPPHASSLRHEQVKTLRAYQWLWRLGRRDVHSATAKTQTG